MSDELTWIKAEITKLQADVGANGPPSATDLCDALGRLLTEYSARFGGPHKVYKTIYVTNGSEYKGRTGHLNDEYGDAWRVVDVGVHTSYTRADSGDYIPYVELAVTVEINHE